MAVSRWLNGVAKRLVTVTESQLRFDFEGAEIIGVTTPLFVSVTAKRSSENELTYDWQGAFVHDASVLFDCLVGHSVASSFHARVVLKENDEALAFGKHCVLPAPESLD